MPIQPNPGNFGGLAELAGSRIGNLGLEVPGSDAWRRWQAEQSVRQQDQAQLQKGLLSFLESGKQDRQLQQEQALKERAMSLQERQQAQQSGIDERKMILMETAQKEQAALQSQKLAMAKLLNEKAERINSMGSFAAQARLAMEQVGTPEEAKALRTEILADAVKEGYIQKSESQSLNKMPLSRFKSALDFKILQLGKVNDYQRLMGSKKETKSSDPSELTPSTKTTLQKDVIDRDQALRELAPIRANFKKEYLTAGGQGTKWASEWADYLQDVPVVGKLANAGAELATGKNKEQREQFIQDSTKYLNSVERFFQQRYRKPITGAQAALDELKELRKSFLSGNMSPAQFQGALDGIVQGYTSEAEFKQNVLSKGMPDQLEATRKFYREKGWTDEEINHQLEQKGYIRR